MSHHELFTKIVGEAVVNFIRKLAVWISIHPERMHFIGHSLGSIVLSFVCKELGTWAPPRAPPSS